MFRTLIARRFVLILPLSIASTFGFCVIASADDPQTPEEFRQAAERLEATARENLASGIERLRPGAEMFREMALSYRDEPAWREQAAALEAEAEQAEKTGDAEKAQRLREEALQKEAEAAFAKAQRRAGLQEREVLDDLQQKLENLVDRARILRQEGAFEDAEHVESQMRELLRVYGLDPQVERAADLRKLALEARFKGAHDNAAMYDREADRLVAEATGRGDVTAKASDTEERTALRAEIESLRTELAALKATVEELRRREPTAESAATDAK